MLYVQLRRIVSTNINCCQIIPSPPFQEIPLRMNENPIRLLSNRYEQKLDVLKSHWSLMKNIIPALNPTYVHVNQPTNHTLNWHHGAKLLLLQRIAQVACMPLENKPTAKNGAEHEVWIMFNFICCYISITTALCYSCLPICTAWGWRYWLHMFVTRVYKVYAFIYSVVLTSYSMQQQLPLLPAKLRGTALQVVQRVCDWDSLPVVLTRANV